MTTAMSERIAQVEPMQARIDSATIELALVSHTNTGKTTLARTLLGRDVGEVRDAPHVTEIVERHLLLESAAGDRLDLADTPGFGDSARLVRRLSGADSPVGWLLREVWDRYRDRPLWCNQQAVRAARESADVLLYLANAAESPRDAGYVASEMQVLRWIGKPVLVLLNQVGPPRPAAEERAEVELWRSYLATFGVVDNVLALDAFARCWVQERVLLDAVAPLVPQEKRAAFARLVSAWQVRSTSRFEASMHELAAELARAARDTELLTTSPSTMQKVLRTFGATREGTDPERLRAMAELANRLDAAIRSGTDQLISLHGLGGAAAATVLQRLHDNFSSREGVSEGRAALWGSVLTGALTGLKADLAAGGLSFGAGMLVGGVIGGFAGAGVARGINTIRGSGAPSVQWSEPFLDGLVRSALLRYLAVAHYGRGRGDYLEGEAPAFWQEEVKQATSAETETLHTLWDAARSQLDSTPEDDPVVEDLARTLSRITLELLDRLYPDHPPHPITGHPDAR